METWENVCRKDARASYPYELANDCSLYFSFSRSNTISKVVRREKQKHLATHFFVLLAISDRKDTAWNHWQPVPPVYPPVHLTCTEASLVIPRETLPLPTTGPSGNVAEVVPRESPL